MKTVEETFLLINEILKVCREGQRLIEVIQSDWSKQGVLAIGDCGVMDHPKPLYFSSLIMGWLVKNIGLYLTA